MASAWESHFVLPSFSVIEPRRMNIWVTTIFDTEVWLLLTDVEVVGVKVARSKVVFVGETTPCCASDGENVLLLELPPPPLPPPPPP